MCAEPASPRRSYAFGLASLLLVAGGCGATGPALNLDQTLTNRDLAMAWSEPINRDEGSFSEQVRVKVALDGGGEVYTRLLVSNVATLDGRAELLGTVTLPDGTQYRSKTKRDRGEWQHGVDGFDATVGEGTLRVTVGRAEGHFVGDGFALDYTITTALPPLRPAGGHFERGGAFYVTTIPIPRGRLEGQLVIDGAEGPTVVPLAGTAYVEHRATDLAPYRMAHRWFKAAQIDAERTVIFSAFQRTKELGGQIQGWLLVADDTGVQLWADDVAVTPAAPSRDDKTSYDVPQVVFVTEAVEGTQRPSFRGVISAEAQTKRTDDLRRLSKIERVIVRRLMSPWTFEFDHGRYLFKQRIGNAGIERAFRGRFKFEYQQLND